MKRIVAIVAGVIVVALVASMAFASGNGNASRDIWGLGVSSSAPAKTVAPAGNGEQRLVLVSRNETETGVDNPPEGESQGDEIFVTASLFRQGKKVGRLDVHAAQTEANFELHRAAIQVTFTATLRKGQITATGVAVFTPRSQAGFDAAITGGTDRYDDVGGDVEVRFTDTSTTFIYDIEDLG
jgi:hypothetical protein